MKNNTLKNSLIFASSMIFLFVTYLLCKQFLFETSMKNIPLSEDDQIMVEIEEAVEQDNQIKISGWGLKFNTVNEKITLLLREVNSDNDEIVIKAKLVENEVVQQYYSTTWDFGQCGFEAFIDKEALKDDVCYEILVVHKCIKQGIKNLIRESQKISTRQYLCNGVLYNYNPDTFFAPEVNDSEIESVIREGNLFLHDLDKRIWVYGHEKNMYLIISYETLGDLTPSPEVALYFKDLNQKTVETVYYYIQEPTVKEQSYYVYSTMIKQDYPIIYFQIGVWGNIDGKRTWIWKEQFKNDFSDYMD